MKKPLLFLAMTMARGFGVSVAVAEIARRLEKKNFKIVIGCIRSDDSFADLDIRLIEPTTRAVLNLIRQTASDTVIAGTSPFFEMIPEIAKIASVWAHEYGDPTPTLFEEDLRERKAIVKGKHENAYDQASGVISISDFISHDINRSESRRIWLGCDHVPPVEPKDSRFFENRRDQTLKIGTLMRLGDGEARYKGNELFLELAEDAASQGLNIEFHLAGRGSESEAERLKNAGFITHLNLDDAEKALYLRDLDIFVSLSLWEGFNLPLVEAQALGTLSLGLDIGAHPEVCPFLISSPTDVLRYARRALEDREWLQRASEMCQRYVRDNFKWDEAAEALTAAVCGDR